MAQKQPEKRPGLFDLQVPFFAPLWRRVALVAVCLGWALLELAWGGPFWALIFAALGLYAAWQFFAVWAPKDDERNNDD
jgi:hypothetical protein